MKCPNCGKELDYPKLEWLDTPEHQKPFIRVSLFCDTPHKQKTFKTKFTMCWYFDITEDYVKNALFSKTRRVSKSKRIE